MKMPLLLAFLVGTGIFSAPFTLSQSSVSVARDSNEEYLAEIRKQIAGREEEPAEKVFQNIELLRGKSASRLPGMMKALTGLLGVDCQHCHVPGHWELEEKTPKVTARQHFAMQAVLNKEYFNDENKVSCWTCHRGKPQAELVPSESK